MSRTTNLTVASTIALALIATVTTSAEACGRGGGGYSGRSSSRLSISYSRSAPHMQSQAYGYNGGNNHRSYGYRQPVYTQPAPQPIVQQPVIQQPLPQQQVVQTPPAQPQAQPQVAQTQPAPSQATPSQAAPAQTAQQSALSALEALGGETNAAAMPQFKPASTGSNAPHVGTWNAAVGSNATVRLELNANGTFTWVANNGGKVSTFQGSFTINGGRLTLIRSNDNQQLAGAWTPGTNGANFKLDGDKTGGLNFNRG